MLRQKDKESYPENLISQEAYYPITLNTDLREFRENSDNWSKTTLRRDKILTSLYSYHWSGFVVICVIFTC